MATYIIKTSRYLKRNPRQEAPEIMCHEYAGQLEVKDSQLSSAAED